MTAKTLQDQLRELGLANKPERSRGQSRKKSRAKKPADSGMSLDQAYRLREREEKQAIRQKKEQKRLEDLQRRRVNKQIQELVDAHALNDKQAEIKRNFLYKGRIRSVLCTPEQLKALNAGELGVVFLRGNYILMLPEHVELARIISEDHIPDLGADSPEDPDEGDQFKVPDDLVW